MGDDDLPAPRRGPATLISRRSIMFAGGMLPLLLASCATVVNRNTPLPEDGTIDLMTLLEARPDTKLFVAALKRSGLVDRIKPGSGPATLFIPPDVVLEALPPERRAVLTDAAAEPAALRAAIGSMIASGQLRLESIAVRNGAINTWTQNNQLRVTGAPSPTAKVQRATLANGRTTVTGPQVGFAKPDILASNGVIHIMDGALLP
jgi:uncharacterized surface protein with fasciclin (FAS1) repeats